MEKGGENRYMRARKKVANLKGFYVHLAWYVVICVLLVGSRLYYLITQGTAPSNADFQNWLNWNIFLVPLIWGAAVAIHAVTVFRPTWKPLARWEERKTREFLEREEEL